MLRLPNRRKNSPSHARFSRGSLRRVRPRRVDPGNRRDRRRCCSGRGRTNSCGRRLPAGPLAVRDSRRLCLDDHRGDRPFAGGERVVGTDRGRADRTGRRQFRAPGLRRTCGTIRRCLWNAGRQAAIGGWMLLPHNENLAGDARLSATLPETPRRSDYRVALPVLWGAVAAVLVGLIAWRKRVARPAMLADCREQRAGRGSGRLVRPPGLSAGAARHWRPVAGSGGLGAIAADGPGARRFHWAVHARRAAGDPRPRACAPGGRRSGVAVGSRSAGGPRLVASGGSLVPPAVGNGLGAGGRRSGPRSARRPQRAGRLPGEARPPTGRHAAGRLAGGRWFGASFGLGPPGPVAARLAERSTKPARGSHNGVGKADGGRTSDSCGGFLHALGPSQGILYDGRRHDECIEGFLAPVGGGCRVDRPPRPRRRRAG